MVNNWIIFFGIGSVILQLSAAFFAYKIYSYNRLAKGWLALVLAFFIQAIRRVFTTYEDLGGEIPMGIFLDRFLMFFISFLIVIALWTMLKNFENFDIVQNKIKKKISKVRKR